MGRIPLPSALEQACHLRHLAEIRRHLQQQLSESPIAVIEAIRRGLVDDCTRIRLQKHLDDWRKALDLPVGHAGRPTQLSDVQGKVAGLRRACSLELETLRIPLRAIRDIAREMEDVSKDLDAVLRELDAGPGDPTRMEELLDRRLQLMSVSFEHAQALHARITGLRSLLDADEEARQAIARGNLRLVVLLARRHAGSRLPLADLIQEGNVGLLRATEMFDPTRGIKFSSYAKWWIREAMAQAMADHSGAFRVPVRELLLASKLRAIANSLGHRLGRAPDLEEIGREAGVSVPRVSRAFRSAARAASLDHPISEHTRSRLGHLLEDRGDGSGPSEADRQIEVRIALALQRLPERARRVIHLRFGLEGTPAQSRLQIARLLDLTPERIRQIEENALELLRSPAVNGDLRAFF